MATKFFDGMDVVVKFEEKEFLGVCTGHAYERIGGDKRKTLLHRIDTNGQVQKEWFLKHEFYLPVIPEVQETEETIEEWTRDNTKSIVSNGDVILSLEEARPYIMEAIKATHSLNEDDIVYNLNLNLNSGNIGISTQDIREVIVEVENRTFVPLKEDKSNASGIETPQKVLYKKQKYSVGQTVIVTYNEKEYRRVIEDTVYENGTHMYSINMNGISSLKWWDENSLKAIEYPGTLDEEVFNDKWTPELRLAQYAMERHRGNEIPTLKKELEDYFAQSILENDGSVKKYHHLIQSPLFLIKQEKEMENKMPEVVESTLENAVDAQEELKKLKEHEKELKEKEKQLKEKVKTLKEKAKEGKIKKTEVKTTKKDTLTFVSPDEFIDSNGEMLVSLSSLVSLLDLGIENAKMVMRPLDEAHRDTLLIAMEDGAQLPPLGVQLTDKGVVVYSGYHRWSAMEKLLKNSFSDEEELQKTREAQIIRVKPANFTTTRELLNATFVANKTNGKEASVNSKTSYAVWLFLTSLEQDEKPIGVREAARQAGLLNHSVVSRRLAKLAEKQEKTIDALVKNEEDIKLVEDDIIEASPKEEEDELEASCKRLFNACVKIHAMNDDIEQLSLYFKSFLTGANAEAVAMIATAMLNNAKSYNV